MKRASKKVRDELRDERQKVMDQMGNAFIPIERKLLK